MADSFFFARTEKVRKSTLCGQAFSGPLVGAAWFCVGTVVAVFFFITALPPDVCTFSVDMI